MEGQDSSGNGSIKLKRLYIARNTDASLSFYADGVGTLKINLRPLTGSPAYPGGLKVMTTADGPYPRAGLFPGTMPYGSYFANVPAGNYQVDWLDEDGQFLSFNVTVTAKLPVYQLVPFGVVVTTPTDPTTPPVTPPTPPTPPTPVDERGYTQRYTIGGYLQT